MIAFAALIAQGAPHRPTDPDAQRLLSGIRPKRIASPDTLLHWAAEATQTPDFLIQSCLAACPDKTEVAALLLPPARGTAPSLSEVLTALTAPNPDWLALALRLPPAPRLILNRLATGTFRVTAKPDAPFTANPKTFRAVLTMIAPQGPTASFALRHGNGLIPIAKLPLTLPETAEILTWARGHILDRFGPNWQVAPDLIFTLTCDGTTPNLRRKAKLDLINPRILAWNRDATADQATALDQFIPL